jgi:hypothetical protein
MGRKSKSVLSRYVDMWAVPGVHPTNVQLMQSLKMADSTHFTRNMDAIGTVSERGPSGDWEKTGLLGIRTDIWKPDAEDVAEILERLRDQRAAELKKEIRKSGRLSAGQQVELRQRIDEDKVMQLECDDIVHRRLVLKLFRTTGKRLNWAGTIEQVTASELQNSFGSARTLLSMAAILPRYEYVVPIPQNHRTFRIGRVFSLSYFHAGRMWPVCLKQRWPAVGTDYDIQVDGNRIGYLNGVMFAMGSDRYVDLFEHELSEQTGFADLLTLFAASASYHKSMARSVKQRIDACRDGDWRQCFMEDEELGIYKNGRAA